uniref:Ribonuclease H-like domain-containing protein n=1 Tax=Tanacetum cinerariifolium TaxID=118510 RepID=A0A6L2KI87_TANCI|nr:ribonuclease H-like domain-containing protein [Tanacetum cinerariifolium]
MCAFFLIFTKFSIIAAVLKDKRLSNSDEDGFLQTLVRALGMERRLMTESLQINAKSNYDVFKVVNYAIVVTRLDFFVSTTSARVTAASEVTTASVKLVLLVLQKLVSQLELLEEKLSQEDVNENLLRSLSPEWNTHARSFLKNIGRKLSFNGNGTIGFDKSKVECYNCHKKGHFARDCFKKSRQQTQGKLKKECAVETSTSIALVSFPPPYTGNFMPPAPDFSFTSLDEFVNKPKVRNCKAKSSEEEPKIVRKNDDALIIEEYVSDNEEEDAEADNIACYVQNKVLVVKPHNKTPYELFHVRTPTLSFMRPFGSPITILNTIDHLGKVDGKADKGFFVGYSLNSKAFRVFNSRTKIVEENLHIRFSKSTPNVVGSGPDWLFDIDALTRTMNYEPIVAGKQFNDFASTKANNNVGQARKEIKPIKNYILLPLWTANLPFSQDPKSSHDDGSKPLSDDGKKVDEDLRKENKCNDQVKDDNVNSTNNVNAVSSTVNVADTNGVNAVGENISIEL